MNVTDSKKIDELRFPMAVMVVAIHSYIVIDGWSYTNIVNQGIGSNVAHFFMIAIAHVLAHVAVPTFFLISGYLFFNNFEDGGGKIWKKKIRSRVYSLFVPYSMDSYIRNISNIIRWCQDFSPRRIDRVASVKWWHSYILV